MPGVTHTPRTLWIFPVTVRRFVAFKPTRARSARPSTRRRRHRRADRRFTSRDMPLALLALLAPGSSTGSPRRPLRRRPAGQRLTLGLSLALSCLLLLLSPPTPGGALAAVADEPFGLDDGIRGGAGSEAAEPDDAEEPDYGAGRAARPSFSRGAPFFPQGTLFKPSPFPRERELELERSL